MLCFIGIWNLEAQGQRTEEEDIALKGGERNGKKDKYRHGCVTWIDGKKHCLLQRGALLGFLWRSKVHVRGEEGMTCINGVMCLYLDGKIAL